MGLSSGHPRIWEAEIRKKHDKWKMVSYEMVKSKKQALVGFMIPRVIAKKASLEGRQAS